jgi:hypothetical protein
LSLISNKSTATFGEMVFLAGSILEKSSWLMMLFVAPVSNSASKWTPLLWNGILGIFEYTYVTEDLNNAFRIWNFRPDINQVSHESMN